MIKWFVRIFLALIVLLAGAVAFFGVRRALAAAQIERVLQTAIQPVLEIGTTSRLEILPLYEESLATGSFQVGHGVSYLVRTDAVNLLLDIGNNPDESPVSPLMSNLQAAGVGWDEIDAVFISHPHPDHLGGIPAWRQKTLSFGESPVDLSRKGIYVPASLTYPGATPIQSQDPTLIGAGVASTGILPFLDVFPMWLFNPRGSEQALVVNVAEQGLVLITGCGHPTLERLVERAEAAFGEPVVGVVGGLHYEAATAQEVEPHIAFLASRNPRLVSLSPHDNGPDAIAAFRTAFPDAYRPIEVGQVIQFP